MKTDGNRLLLKPKHRLQPFIKLTMCEGASLTGSGQGPVLGCTQNTNKHLHSISRKFFDQLDDYKIQVLLKYYTV